MNGYLLLIIGKQPIYRIVFRPSLSEALEILPKLRKESEGRVEVLKIVNRDTKIPETEEDNSNEYSKNGD